MNLTPSLRLSVRFAGLSAAVMLASCGYSPMYAPAAGEANAAGRVQVGKVEAVQYRKNLGQRRSAQTVYQDLKLSFPNTGADMDTVEILIEEAETTLAVEKTATVQRATVDITGNVTLTDANGKVLLRTILYTSSPFSTETSPYSTETGKTFARTTAARNLADEVSRRLYLYYGTNPLPAGVKAPAEAAEPAAQPAK